MQMAMRQRDEQYHAEVMAMATGHASTLSEARLEVDAQMLLATDLRTSLANVEHEVGTMRASIGHVEECAGEAVTRMRHEVEFERSTARLNQRDNSELRTKLVSAAKAFQQEQQAHSRLCIETENLRRQEGNCLTQATVMQQEILSVRATAREDSHSAVRHCLMSMYMPSSGRS